MEWLLLLIPIIIGLFFYLVYNKSITVVEALSPLLIVVLMLFFSKSCSVSRQTSDVEYLNGYLVSATYYEDWTEPRTCSYTTCSGSGKNRVCTTHYYSCPQYHPEKWEVKDNRGYTWSISKEEYDKYLKLWGNEKFVDLDRNYTNGDDGDSYVTNFDRKKEHIFLTTIEHGYENKVQASHSLFKIPQISDEKAKKLGLYDYPDIVSYKQHRLIGLKSPKLDHKMEILNAYLGKSKQVNSYLIIFNNKDKKYGDYQERYWMGGNKNEFNVILGFNKNKTLSWFKIMTFSESQELKINIRNYLSSHINKGIDLSKFIDYLHGQIKTNYTRKNFSDFDYLEIDFTDTEFMWLGIIIFIVVIGFNIFSVFNNIDPKIHEEGTLCGEKLIISNDQYGNYEIGYFYHPSTKSLYRIKNRYFYGNREFIRLVSPEIINKLKNKENVNIDDVKDKERIPYISKILNYVTNFNLKIMDKINSVLLKLILKFKK